MASTSNLAGVIGFFKGPHDLLEAMEKTRQSGKFDSFDAYSPFPIHGMDDAQGLRRSNLPYVTFVFGLLGFLTAFGLQYWTSAIDWPLNVGGKPLNSWPAFVPIMFELTVLFAGISTVFGMFAFNRLPNITSKAFDPAITRDKFAILIEAGKKKFQEGDAEDFLKKLGAQDVRKVYNEGWF